MAELNSLSRALPLALTSTQVSRFQAKPPSAHRVEQLEETSLQPYTCKSLHEIGQLLPLRILVEEISF